MNPELVDMVNKLVARWYQLPDIEENYVRFRAIFQALMWIGNNPQATKEQCMDKIRQLKEEMWV